MATAKKGAKKGAAAKPAAKKVAKKTVAGNKVTAEVKSKGSKKDSANCERIDIGGGKVVDLCVVKPKKPKKPRREYTAEEDAMADIRLDQLAEESARRRPLYEAIARRGFAPVPSDDVRAVMAQRAMMAQQAAPSYSGPQAAPSYSGPQEEFAIRRPKNEVYRQPSLNVRRINAPEAPVGRMTKAQKQQLRLSEIAEGLERSRSKGAVGGAFMPVRPSTGVRRRKRRASR